MQILLKKFPILFSVKTDLKKLRYAYGISSIVNNTNRAKISKCPTMQLHYTLLDIDQQPKQSTYDEIFDYLCETQDSPFIITQSKRGFHAIVFNALPFHKTAENMLSVPYCDRNFVAIGIKRGYWFLETYIPIFLENLAYMRIERTK